MMINPGQLLSNPIAAVGLRAALGGYVIYMARKFYADPLGYFRKAARGMLEFPWLGPVVRWLACFCLWGGCFIVATVIAVQIFGLHGDSLACALILFAAIATWFLLPAREGRNPAGEHGVENLRGPK
ncbi:MAG: hypothetical protein ABSF16_11225 [Terracidiphilus sp.]|jgi:hypothetical protein